MNYVEIVNRTRKRDPAEQAKLLNELTEMIKPQPPQRGKRSIIELERLGAKIWAGIDAREYVRQMREGWERR
jgi:hypothetical protein